MDQHETRTDGEGQEETQAIGEPPQSAQSDEVKPDLQHEEGGEAAAEVGSEPGSSGGDQPPDAPLDVGLRVGPYIVERSLGDDSRRVYVAREAPADAKDAEAEEHPRPELLIGSASADSEAAVQIIALQLHHPRLLTPHALIHPDEQAYLAFVLPEGIASGEVAVVGSTTPLTALDTLKAGVGLADALAYLHRSGVVHQSISTDALCLLRGRAYLAVLASATFAPADEAERSAHFAKDVSALAQSLAALAEARTEAPVAPMSPEESLRDLIARGAGGDFQTAEELQAACGAAVQLALHGVAGAAETEATARVAFRAGSATSIGRVRTQNQDAAAIATFDVVDDVVGDMPVGVFLVADGMGGEARGELASRLGARVVASQMVQYFMLPSMATAITNPLGTLDEVDETPAAQDDTGLAQTLANAVAEANTQVRALAEALGEATGSTITAVAISGIQAAIAHLGDSRAYLLHGDTMVRMTEDHSLLARLEAMDHPLLHDPAFAVPRNFLYRSLGQEEEAPPDILEFRVQPDDRMMICSDGLWDEVDDKQIAQILALSRDPETCAQALVRLANEGGGHDNSTAVVVFVEEVPPDSAASMERIEWQDSELEMEPDEATSDQEANATSATNGGEA